jgi:hypothetical protein
MDTHQIGAFFLLNESIQGKGYVIYIHIVGYAICFHSMLTNCISKGIEAISL